MKPKTPTAADNAGFQTEFGRFIPFVPGYYRDNVPYADSIGDDVFKRPTLSTAIETKATLSMVVKDLILFSSMVFFMHRWGLLRKWKSGIDLGGAEGTCAALFKAAGFILNIPPALTLSITLRSLAAIILRKLLPSYATSARQTVLELEGCSPPCNAHGLASIFFLTNR